MGAGLTAITIARGMLQMSLKRGHGIARLRLLHIVPADDMMSGIRHPAVSAGEERVMTPSWRIDLTGPATSEMETEPGTESAGVLQCPGCPREGYQTSMSLALGVV
jgi:hypothetical protein